MRIGTIDYIDILRSELRSLESQMSKGGMSEEEEDDLQSQIEQKLEEIEDYEKEFRLDKWYNGIKEGFHKEVDNEMIKSSLKQMEEVNEVEMNSHIHRKSWNERPTIENNRFSTIKTNRNWRFGVIL